MNLMDVVMLQGVKSQYHGIIVFISNAVITISWACHFYLLEYVIVVLLAWADKRGYHTSRAARPDSYRAGKPPPTWSS